MPTAERLVESVVAADVGRVTGGGTLLSTFGTLTGGLEDARLPAGKSIISLIVELLYSF